MFRADSSRETLNICMYHKRSADFVSRRRFLFSTCGSLIETPKFRIRGESGRPYPDIFPLFQHRNGRRIAAESRRSTWIHGFHDNSR